MNKIKPKIELVEDELQTCVYINGEFIISFWDDGTSFFVTGNVDKPVCWGNWINAINEIKRINAVNEKIKARRRKNENN